MSYKNFFKLAILIFIAQVVVRELGIIEFNWYHTNSNFSSMDHCIFKSESLDSLGNALDFIDLDANPEFNVHTTYDSVEDISRGIFQVDEETNLKLGIGRLIPFYKYITFSSRTPFNYEILVKRNGEIRLYKIKGKAMIDGKLTILGFCSARKTKEIVLRATDKTTLARIKDCLENQFK